ncbi:sequence-specific DNA binding transcription factors [Striga asiatica]|uniref:Sequence-specific DNA binding transcription factors n=1 Tax=Striga asiatica TaxID=4170 RepID=A0A5A7P7W2_STRAF|nr:sequence-specific DNA binding transcription factors [Striga asiatica]
MVVGHVLGYAIGAAGGFRRRLPEKNELDHLYFAVRRRTTTDMTTRSALHKHMTAATSVGTLNRSAAKNPTSRSLVNMPFSSPLRHAPCQKIARPPTPPFVGKPATLPSPGCMLISQSNFSASREKKARLFRIGTKNGADEDGIEGRHLQQPGGGDNFPPPPCPAPRPRRPQHRDLQGCRRALARRLPQQRLLSAPL